MLVLYTDLSDEALDAKIADLTAAYEQAVMGGYAVVVAGNGRRVEYTQKNLNGLLGLLNAAQRVKQERAGVQVSGAIRVSFPYGDGYGG